VSHDLTPKLEPSRTATWDSAGVVIGATLGRYRIEQRIGQGGMGTVFRATHLSLKRAVALKVLPSDTELARNGGERFAREIEMLGRLNHDHVVRATDAGIENGVPFLVMDFVDGVDLKRLVRQGGRLGLPDACEIIRQAGVGLEYIHRQELIHRDIKPSNLMLDRAGVVRILDLGLARWREPYNADLTPSGTAMGTADYLAPEQASDAHRVDVRADIYSLGCTWYELLVGHPPFGEPRFRSNAQKIFAHCNEPFPSLAEFPAPQPLKSLLASMTAKHPDDRPATPQQVVDRVARFSSESDLPALVQETERHESRGTDSRSFVLPPAIRTSPTSVTRRVVSPKRLRRWSGVAGLVSLTLLSVGILAAALFFNGWMRTGDDGRTPNGGGGDASDVKQTPASPPCSDPGFLDHCQPLKWQRLLECEPQEELWVRGQGAAVQKHDVAAEQFFVSGMSESVFSLGRVTRPSFTFQIEIAQPRWPGGAGIFWGLQTWSLSEAQKQRGEPYGRLQYVMLKTRRLRGAVVGMAVVRGLGELRYRNGRRELVCNEKRQEDIPLPTTDLLLEIVVEDHQLRKLRVGNTTFRSEIVRLINREFDARLYQGRLGMLTLASHCFFRNARYLAHSREPK